MSSTRQTSERLRRELAEVAASSATIHERAGEILAQLGRIVAFDVGWLAVRDPELRRHVPLATTGDAAPLRDYFGRPEADAEVEALGLNRLRPPILASEIPGPLSEVRAWGEHLLPAGLRQGLAVGLFTSGGRHIGFLGLLSADRAHPSHAERNVVAVCTTVIADGLDRTREIAETARAIQSAVAGVVLTRGGDVLPLPGLPDDGMLAPGSPILLVAADELARGGPHASFLVPAPSNDEVQLIRVTALDFTRPELDNLTAAVLLCPAGDLHGLRVLDLRVLGLLVDGITDIPTMGQALHVAGRAVSDSLDRSMAALGSDDLTSATLRGLRSGLRIPPGVSAG
ncbi:hypothetical protein ACVBEQ_05655 [Nakamurella sp. GG22]